MPIRRRFLNIPDYLGANLEDIVKELEEMSAATKEDICELEKIKKKVEDDATCPTKANLVKKYIRYWLSLLEDFETDLARILKEMPEGVDERHLEIMRQIHERSLNERGGSCSSYEEEVLESLENEALVSWADRALDIAFQRFNDNSTLEDLGTRLRTFVGSKKDLRSGTKGIEPLEVPQGSYWGDISIRFLNEESVEIRAGRKPLGAWKFTVLGFEDKRAKRPDQVWQTLYFLGLHRGEISWETRGDSAKMRLTLQKNISILRKRLKALFVMSEDPFYSYDKAKAYKAKFSIIAKREDP